MSRHLADGKEHSKGRNLEIDLLRAVSILLVLWHHHFALFQWDYVLPRSWNVGWQGVELFFIISGFVISQTLVPPLQQALSIHDRHQRMHATIVTVKAFFIRRFFRLFPACWFWIFAYLGFSIFFNSLGLYGEPGEVLKAMEWVATNSINYGLIKQQTHTLAWHWSLVIEDQFYLIYPLFLCLVTTRPRRLLSLLFYSLAVSFILRPYVYAQHYMRNDSILEFESIVTGCAVYFLSQEDWYKYLLPKVLTKRVYGFLFTTIFLTVFACLTNIVPDPVQHPLINVMGGILVMLASFEKGIILPVGALRGVFNWIGRRSYAIYLLNMPAIFFTQELWQRIGEAYNLKIDASYNPHFLITAYAYIFIFAELTYRFIEKPMIKKGARISHALETTVAEIMEPTEKAA